jgi:LacI family transcriptional regulator
MPQPRKRVLLVGPPVFSYVRAVLRGVRDYVRRHEGWSIELHPESIRDLLSARPPGSIDGLIAQITRVPNMQLCVDRGVPTVNYSTSLPDLIVPRACSDDYAAGVMGAEHLLERGFRTLGYIGLYDDGEAPRHHFSRERGRGFCDRVRQTPGVRLVTFDHLEASAPGVGWDSAMDRWLQDLPKPIGLMAANDVRARHVANRCELHGLRVPEQVAVLGADNDDLECELSAMPLSSVQIDFQRVGYRAAEMLEKLMAGEPLPEREIKVPPLRVVTRTSTDILAIEDELVSGAIRLIRERTSKPLSVDEVADELAVSRRHLERRFKAAVGHAPHDEIRRSHVERAKRLLAETDLPMTDVADASGYKDAKSLSTLFTREVGVTPTAFRKQHRVR